MATITGPALPDMPWQERPADCSDAVWRHTGNPIIRRDALPDSNSIFNSAVVPFGAGYAGVFRCDDRARRCALHTGFSRDGVQWELSPEPIEFTGGLSFEYGYDPRVCRIDGEYIVTWCNGYADYPTIGIAETAEFKIFLSRSPDLTFWGEHRLVMKTGGGWQRTKIGAGPTPIETSEGWLLFYHGVLTSCNGMTYSFGAALLDPEEPWKVIARDRHYLMSPQTLYECVGDTPNVVFPCAALADAPTGRIAIYYGCADTCTGLAFTTLDNVLEHLKKQK